jgi:N-acetylglucosamine PTS system EIICBA or EIICB component
VLYALHAVLTGTSMVLMAMLDVHLGFGFSAWLFDYLLNFNFATRPLWLLPVGTAYFLLYYALFRFFIVRFNLPTPGREPSTEAAGGAPSPDDAAAAMVKALGGAGNLQSVDACTTRLRLVVHDRERVEVDALKALGAHGVVMPGKNAVQVVLGPVADQVAERIRSLAAVESASGEDAAGYPERAASAAPADREALVAAFGGADNVLSVEALAGRIRIAVVDRAAVDEAAIPPDVRAVACPRPRSRTCCDQSCRNPPPGDPLSKPTGACSCCPICRRPIRGARRAPAEGAPRPGRPPADRA